MTKNNHSNGVAREPLLHGVMGCGAVADYGHLPAIVVQPGLRLHAVFDPDPKRAEAARRKFGAAHAFSDIHAFLASGIRSVSVTSPAPTHHANVLLAADLGLHVLCEKPLAMDAEEGRAMVDAMGRAGRVLFVGFTYRFSGVARAIREQLALGAVGEPRLLRLIYNWDLHGRDLRGGDHPQPGPINQRRELRMQEGGPMVDCGVHQIDLARWWLGSEVVACESRGTWIEERHEAPDHLVLDLRHASGVRTVVEMSYSFGHTCPKPYADFVYEVVGTDGVLRFDRERGLFRLWSSAGVTDLPIGHEKDFDGMYAAFVAVVAGVPGATHPTGEDALIATELAWRGVREAQARRNAEQTLAAPIRA